MSYKELDAWKDARALVKDIYLATASFPPAEQFGLTSQIRRAAVSIPANIAEGYGRRSPGAFVQFLRIAKGSVNELETLLLLSTDLEILETCDELQERTAKIGSMLTNLISKIEASTVREDMSPYQSEPTRTNPN